ncbi:MAG: hypothetical protein ACI4N1_12830 [Stenotrophomonas koreensis]
MIELALICLAPAAGGALLHHLWLTRPKATRYVGLAVGQTPTTRRRRAMAVRRGEQA